MRISSVYLTAALLLGPLGSQGYSTSHWQTVPNSETGLSTPGVSSLLTDVDGRLWAGSPSGEIVIMVDGQWKSMTPEGAHGEVSKFALSTSGEIWTIIGADQLWLFQGDQWSTFDGSITMAIPKPAPASPDLYGLACLDPQIKRTDGDGVLNGVPYVSGEIHDLIADGTGGLWVTTDGLRSVLIFSEQMLHCWSAPQFSNYQPGTLALGPDNAVYYLEPLTGLFRFTDSGWEELSHPRDVALVTSLPGGTVYAYWSSLWRLEGDGFTQIYQPASVDNYIGQVLPTESGDVWAIEWTNTGGKTGNAVVRIGIDGNLSRISYPHGEEFPRNARVSIATTPDGRLWLGDRQGLFVWMQDPTSVRQDAWANVKSSTVER